MGLDVYANLIIGVRVTRADFLTTKTTPRQCAKGHKHATKKFCEEDGTAFQVRTIEEAKPHFAKAAADIFGEGMDAEEAYRAMFDGGPLFAVDAITGPEDEGTIAIGKRLLPQISHRRAPESPIAMDLADIRAAFKDAERIAETWAGITGRPVEMFLSMYVSV